MAQIEQINLPTAYDIADNDRLTGTKGSNPGDDKGFPWSLLKQQLSLIFQGLPDELLNGGEITTLVDVVTIQPATYRIGKLLYAFGTEYTTTVVFSASGFQRYIGFYGNTSNGVTVVEGAESTIAILPVQPPNTAVLGLILVGDLAIGGVTVDLSGYALKSDLGEKTNLLTTNRLTVVDAVNEIEQSLSSLESDQITLKIFKVSNYSTL